MFDKRKIAQLEVHAADLVALRQREVPALHTCQTELSHSATHLQLPRKTTATLTYAWYGMEALADTHAAALRALADEHDFAAQTLAQSAIVLAVDVLYILGDLEGDRISGALRHLADVQLARYRAWQAALSEDPVPGQLAARLSAELGKTRWYADAPAWPNLGARADASGVGLWVHPILSTATDAEQTLAQELQNFLLCEQGSVTLRQAAHAHRSARIGSDAAYMEAIALYLFAQALHALATVIGDKVAITVAQSAVERLDNLLIEHQKQAEVHRNDQNTYIKLR